jgi:hypothetical protein
LCGYDHERDEREAQRMARRERAVLRHMGVIPQLLVSRDFVGYDAKLSQTRSCNEREKMR